MKIDQKTMYACLHLALNSRLVVNHNMDESESKMEKLFDLLIMRAYLVAEQKLNWRKSNLMWD